MNHARWILLFDLSRLQVEGCPPKGAGFERCVRDFSRTIARPSAVDSLWSLHGGSSGGTKGRGGTPKNGRFCTYPLYLPPWSKGTFWGRFWGTFRGTPHGQIGKACMISGGRAGGTPRSKGGRGGSTPHRTLETDGSTLTHEVTRKEKELREAENNIKAEVLITQEVRRRHHHGDRVQVWRRSPP